MAVAKDGEKTGGRALWLAVLALVVSSGWAWGAGKFPLLWSVNLKSGVYMAATTADLDGDGMDEILAVGINSIFALKGDGKVAWEWRVEGRFCAYPSVLLRPGASPLVYAADNQGDFYCLDGRGKKVWQAKLHGPSNWAAAPVADVNGDGRPEVIQPDEQGTLWAFDAVTGKVIWETTIAGGISSSPSVGNLAGDERPEVAVVSDTGTLAVVAGDGKVAWSRQLGRGSSSSPVIFTAADGEGRVVAGSADGEVFCYDRQGKLLWQHGAGSPMDSSLSVADPDLDGRADIFLVTSGGVIERLDEDGGVIWTLDMQTRSDGGGSIADANGDGELEYLLCTHKAQVLVVNMRGEVIWQYQLPVNNAYNATPTLGEVSKASAGLEMVVPGGDSGWLFCFGTPAPRDAKIQWGAYRRDRTMVGSWPGLAHSATVTMAPVDLAWNKVLAAQGVRFRIYAPGTGGQVLRAEAVCVRPDGSRQAATANITGGRGALLLPLEALVPGGYDFSWSLGTGQGKVLASGRRQLTLQPFANDRGLVQQAISALDRVAGTVGEVLPRSAAALRRESRLLADTARHLAPGQDACLHDDSLRRQVVADTKELAAAAQRALQLAPVVEQAAARGPGTSLVTSAGPTWDSRGVADLLPEGAPGLLKLTGRVVPGEHESVAVNLLNITDRELAVRVSITSPEGVTVTPRRALGVVTAAGNTAWDALPPLDETSIISIPSLSSAQLWLEVAVGQVAAGEHRVHVRMQALNGAGVLEAAHNEQAVAPPESSVELTLRVLPFEMAPTGALRLCTWAYVESSLLGHAVDATYADLWAHGNNVYTITALGEASYDEQGRLTGPVDYAKLDTLVARWRGKDVVLLLNSFPLLKPTSAQDKGYGSPAYRKALRPYLDDLVAHMGALGFDRQHFALYPIDEPGGIGWPSIYQMGEFGKLVREANPTVPIYADAGGSDPAMFAYLAPYIDIWCPGVTMVATEPEKMAAMRANGKPIWSYNCSYNNYNKAMTPGGSLKEADVVSEYRAAGLWAFRHRVTGIGFWTYCTSPEDPWTRTRTEYVMVYPGRSGPVTSRRWEGVREGIEDYRILAALKERLAAGALPETAKAGIKHLLEVSLPQFVDGVTDEAGLNSLREEMLDCVEAAGAK